jgi:hypothetical protein
MPSIIMVGLMVFPYVDSNPLGNGYLLIEAAPVFAADVWLGLLRILLIVINIYSWPG